MQNKLIVPARLEKAAKELKDNMSILLGCSDEVKEIIELALKQDLLRYRDGKGEIVIATNGTFLATAYCLPDDCEIVVQDEKPVIPQWIKNGFTVCSVDMLDDTRFRVNLPAGWFNAEALPAALRCEGWVFCGWLHQKVDTPQSVSFGYYSGWTKKICPEMEENLDKTPSTAYASVWQKVGN